MILGEGHRGSHTRGGPLSRCGMSLCALWRSIGTETFGAGFTFYPAGYEHPHLELCNELRHRLRSTYSLFPRRGYMILLQMKSRSRVLRMKLETGTHRMLPSFPVSAEVAGSLTWSLPCPNCQQSFLFNRIYLEVELGKNEHQTPQPRIGSKACYQRCGCRCALLLGAQVGIPLSPTCLTRPVGGSQASYQCGVYSLSAPSHSQYMVPTT